MIYCAHMKHKGLIITGFVVILLIGFAVVLAKMPGKPGKLDSFAQCLSEKGAMFYGAFWCPHCRDQKLLFGKSQKLMPYTECSTPDSKSQLPICIEKKITIYPTWEFADGTRKEGVLPLEELATITGCVLP